MHARDKSRARRAHTRGRGEHGRTANDNGYGYRGSSLACEKEERARASARRKRGGSARASARVHKEHGRTVTSRLCAGKSDTSRALARARGVGIYARNISPATHISGFRISSPRNNDSPGLLSADPSLYGLGLSYTPSPLTSSQGPLPPLPFLHIPFHFTGCVCGRSEMISHLTRRIEALMMEKKTIEKPWREYSASGNRT